MKLTLLACIVVCSQFVAAQEIKPLRLHDPRASILSRAGSPEMTYVPRTREFFDGDRFLELSAIWGRVADVFSRKTADNEFRIMVFYGDDLSQSRLHPALRANQLVFELDKPVSAQQAMKDVAEASAVCSSGCDIYESRLDCQIVEIPSGPEPETPTVFLHGDSADKDCNIGTRKIVSVDIEPSNRSLLSGPMFVRIEKQ